MDSTAKRTRPRDPLFRVRNRPSVDQWAADESMTLAEAVALFFPDGPLTIKSFRTAAKRGQLAVRRVSGRDFTTPDAVREMLRPELRVPTREAANERPAAPGRPKEPEMRAAQERALEAVRGLRDRRRVPKKPAAS
ncbi:hypothetical protein ACO2RV_21205 [Ancylobacter sp. VNQ12]|uniref:hypothetical protein n=1 Tax=Ancylobacter sp. VNQ12 TaxID=3400920 RepID=UPI003C10FBFB